MTGLAILTLAIAVIGAVLGIINTCTNIWTARRRVRVKLAVTSKVGYPSPDGGMILARGLSGTAPAGIDLARPAHLAIEVVNLSDFPVTIDEFGIDCGKERQVWSNPLLARGKAAPPRLAFREAVTASLPIDSIPLEFLADGVPYCSMEGGAMTCGDNLAWRELYELLRAQAGK